MTSKKRVWTEKEVDKIIWSSVVLSMLFAFCLVALVYFFFVLKPSSQPQENWQCVMEETKTEKVEVGYVFDKWYERECLMAEWIIIGEYGTFYESGYSWIDKIAKDINDTQLGASLRYHRRHGSDVHYELTGKNYTATCNIGEWVMGYKDVNFTSCLIEGLDCKETQDIFCGSGLNDGEYVLTTTNVDSVFDEDESEKIWDFCKTSFITSSEPKSECKKHRDAQTKEECGRFLEKTDTKKYNITCCEELNEINIGSYEANCSQDARFQYYVCMETETIETEKLVCGDESYDMEGMR